MFLKNRNISSNIKRSKVTDYAALTNTFLARGNFTRLLISLDPDKDPQKIGPDLDPNLISVSDRFFFL